MARLQRRDRLSFQSLHIYYTECLCLYYHTVSTQCDHGEVRLVNGSVHNEGIVEVCISTASGKIWAIVCATYWEDGSRQYSWDNDDAMVVCRQLGYTPAGKLSSIIIIMNNDCSL